MWAVKCDAKSFAPKVKEILIGVRYTATPGSIIIEGVLTDLHWGGGRIITGRSTLDEPLQVEKLVFKPNEDVGVGVQTFEFDDMFLGTGKALVAGWVAKTKTMNPVHVGVPAINMDLRITGNSLP